MAIGKMFEILIVSGNHAERMFLTKLTQYALSDGATNLWFSAGTELVDENKGLIIGTFHHVFHVEQMAGVSTQVVFQTLLIAYVNHDIVENTGLRPVTNGNAYTHLEHILQQADSLQAHGFAAGVRS